MEEDTPPESGGGAPAPVEPDRPSRPPPPESERVPGLEFRVVEEGQSRRVIEVTVPAAVFEEAVQTELRQIRKRTQIRGFRRGKAPKARIEQLYGSGATDRSISRLLNLAARQSLHELNLSPLDLPKADPTEAAPGGPLTARLSFSVWPDLGTLDLSGLEATARKTSVTESDIGETLEAMRREKANPGPITGRGIQDDDLIVGDLEESDTADPDSPPRRTGDVTLQVGTGAYHPALHEALQGAQPGDTVVATAQFGEQSPDLERAGRRLRAQLTIRQATAPVLPPLDDDFARQFGASSLLALRGDIRDRLRARAQADDERALARQLVDALLAKNPVEPPAPLVERDLEGRVRALAGGLAGRGMREETVRANIERHLPTLRADCERAVTSTILMDALAEQESIEPDEEAVRETIEKEAEAAKKSPAALRAAMEKNGQLERLRTALRRDAAVDFLREKALIHEPDADLEAPS